MQRRPERKRPSSVAALFDLDNTLLAGDSDHLWGEYLASIGAVDAQTHRAQNNRFLDQYKQGRLNVAAFLAFQLGLLARQNADALVQWRRDFIATFIKPIVLSDGIDLINNHRARGHRVVIATSTNSFITRPIAALLGVDDLVATEPEFDGVRFTGQVSGEPCYGEGKASRVKRWAAAHALELSESWFYTDSITDLPLMLCVGHPVAVDPDEQLSRHAAANTWPVISLRSVKG